MSSSKSKSSAGVGVSRLLFFGGDLVFLVVGDDLLRGLRVVEGLSVEEDFGGETWGLRVKIG